MAREDNIDAAQMQAAYDLPAEAISPNLGWDVTALAEDVDPTLTEAEINEGLRKAKADGESMLRTGQGDPGVAGAKADIVEHKDNPTVVFRTLSEAGADKSNHLGALFSLILPVIAGAAIGGKKGALHAVVGGGTHILKEQEAQKEQARDIERAEIAEKMRRQRLEESLEGQKELAQYKQMLKGGDGEDFEERLEKERKISEARSLGTGDAKVKTESRTRANKLAGIASQAEGYLEELKSLGEGENWATFKVKKATTASELGRLSKSIKLWAMELLKEKQGSRPSDFDLKIILDAIEGDFITGPKGAAALFERAIKQTRQIEAFERKVADGASLSAQDEAFRERFDPQRSRASQVAKALRSLKDKDKTKDQAMSVLKDKGLEAYADILDYVYE